MAAPVDRKGLEERLNKELRELRKLSEKSQRYKTQLADLTDELVTWPQGTREIWSEILMQKSQEAKKKSNSEKKLILDAEKEKKRADDAKKELMKVAVIKQREFTKKQDAVLQRAKDEVAKMAVDFEAEQRVRQEQQEQYTAIINAKLDEKKRRGKAQQQADTTHKVVIEISKAGIEAQNGQARQACGICKL